MKTFTGVIILVVVSAILVGVLWWFADSRPETVAGETESVYDTLDLSVECSADTEAEWDSCCEDACVPFCDDFKQDVFKHYSNMNLCTCWCE